MTRFKYRTNAPRHIAAVVMPIKNNVSSTKPTLPALRFFLRLFAKFTPPVLLLSTIQNIVVHIIPQFT